MRQNSISSVLNFFRYYSGTNHLFYKAFLMMFAVLLKSSSCTPFHRFFFDLFTCPKKYPSICTNREKANYPLFWKLFSICRKFLGFDQRVSSQSVQFAVRENIPSKGRQWESPFYNENSKKFNFYVLHKKSSQLVADEKGIFDEIFWNFFKMCKLFTFSLFRFFNIRLWFVPSLSGISEQF